MRPTDTFSRRYTRSQSIGIAGGRPSSSYYFVGSQADNLFYLDPSFKSSGPVADTPEFHRTRTRARGANSTNNTRAGFSVTSRSPSIANVTRVEPYGLVRIFTLYTSLIDTRTVPSTMLVYGLWYGSWLISYRITPVVYGRMPLRYGAQP